MLKRLGYLIDYVWRVFATGLCFSLFGIGALILAYLIIPSIWLFAKKSVHRDIAQYAIHCCFKAFVTLMHYSGVGKFKLEGFEKIAQDRGCLLMSNHPTLIDYVVIISQLKRCDNIVKQALWNNAFLHRIVQVADYIPNEQSEQTLERIQDSLASGHNILVFPEGTRTKNAQAPELKRGAAQIAVRLKCPVRLIHVRCEPPTLAKHNKWYKIPPRRAVFTVKVGRLIPPEEFLEEDTPPSLLARRLTQTLTTQFTQELCT